VPITSYLALNIALGWTHVDFSSSASFLLFQLPFSSSCVSPFTLFPPTHQLRDTDGGLCPFPATNRHIEPVAGWTSRFSSSLTSPDFSCTGTSVWQGFLCRPSEPRLPYRLEARASPNIAMEIPPRRSPREAAAMPSIYIENARSPKVFGSSGRSPHSASLSSRPMAISKDRSAMAGAPPPLPPPQFVPVDGPHSDQYVQHLQRERYRREQAEELPHYKSRTEFDEGYGSMSFGSNGSKGSMNFGAHQFQFQPSVTDYDNSMVKKFDARRTFENRSPPRRGLSSSAWELPRPSERLPHLQPLSLPTRTKQPASLLNSPSRFTETPLHSAVEPRNNPFGYGEPRETIESDGYPVGRSRRTNSGSLPDDATVSTQGSDDHMVDDTDFAMEETSRLRDFHLHHMPSQDFQAAGQKRRASSPPGDEPPHSLQTSTDHLRRRDVVSRGSPTPRLSVIPQGSVSSVSSNGRSSSHTSTLSLTASTMASTASFSGGRSPGGMSPGGISPTEASMCGSPYATPISLTASPRSTFARTPHHRTLSEHQNRMLASPRKVSELPKPASSKIQGFLMCDCCPKKPKKFETAEELRYGLNTAPLSYSILNS